MLKLVEIINTLPKSVCRVVLYAESKDDRSQAALEEFQSKSGFTVAGGSFIYDCDKEIIVTATDGQLGPEDDSNTDLHYWLTHTEFESAGSKVVDLHALADGSLSEEEQIHALNNLINSCMGGGGEPIITTEQVIERFNNGEFGHWEYPEEGEEYFVPATEADAVPFDFFMPDFIQTTLEVTEGQELAGWDEEKQEDIYITVLRDYNYGRHDNWRIDNQAPDNVPTTFGDIISGTNIRFWVLGGKSK